MTQITFSENEEQTLIDCWQRVKEQLHLSTQRANRNEDSVSLIAVSKTKPAEMIITLAKQGQINFAENYLQEAISKIHRIKTELPDSNIVWHYIGHIQRNKTRDIAENFDWVHTIEREIIAKRLNEQRPSNLAPLNVLIQVNIDEESSKSGCHPSEVSKLMDSILSYPRLQLRGLMIIPSTSSQDAFARTQQLFKQLARTHPQMRNWDTLSMGMSNDMEEAIQYESTMVRIGTAIFGKRDYPTPNATLN